MPNTDADRPIRLLHLSDCHFRVDKAWDSDPVLRALVRFIEKEVQSGLHPDLVAITGDLASAGTAAEYTLALEWLDRHLWPTIKPELARDRLLLVPGNHDADRDLVSKGVGFMQDGLLKEGTHDAVAALLRNEHDRESLLLRHDAYLHFYSQWLGAVQPLPWWQRTIEVRGQRLHIAGLDSAWMAYGGQVDRGRLLLSRWQLNQTVLHPDGDGAHWRLVLLHHPFDYLAEFDAQEARETIHLHRDLVLRGHMHEGDVYFVRPPDPSRACLEVAAGCIYDDS
ncbi:MAG TPA: metallophosphoesterase, partial [Lamprocystis sp. (in: g-proteobacteria)]|nr:metallophosphoesterase [Lamprocystis sp. (in: g-proteobacteria)]